MPDLEPITREEMLLDGQDLEPITRKEMFIKRIYDKTQVIPEPITREEIFLKKAGDETTDVTIEQLNVSENGTYSEEGVAYSPVIVNVPAPPIPDNAYLLKDIPNTPTAIATFNASALPMPSLKVAIEPQQDLHGYDHPWVGGAGKNKLPLTVDGIKADNGGANTWSGNTKEISGVTYTILTDDGNNVIGIKANGTSTSSYAYLYLSKAFSAISGTSYTISGSPNGASASTFRIFTESNSAFASGNRLSDDSETDKTRTADADEDCEVFIQVFNGNTLNNVTFYPMIILASISDATFAPYSNICPISGWDEANVVVSPTTDAEDGTTYTIQFKDGSNPLTVYGGTLDVVSGVLTVTHVIKVYSGNSSEGWYADGTQSGLTYRMKATDVPNNIKLPQSNTEAMSAISNQFIAISADNIFLGNEGIGIPTNGSYLTLYSSVYNTNDVSLWKTYLASNNLQVMYELATPQTIQLTPTQVNSLMGVNNIWADCGKIIDGQYFSKEV